MNWRDDFKEGAFTPRERAQRVSLAFLTHRAELASESDTVFRAAGPLVAADLINVMVDVILDFLSPELADRVRAELGHRG